METIDVPELVQASVHALGLVGIPVTAVCFLLLIRPLVSDGKAGRKRFELAKRGLSENGGRLNLVRHLVLPLVGVTVLTVSFAIEEEVREGPSRAIQALSGEGAQATWILQPGTGHLMNDSRIPADDTERIIQWLSDDGISAVPFKATLASLDADGRLLTGFVFAVDDEAGLSPVPAPGSRCESNDGLPCVIGSGRGLVVDSGNGLELGDEVIIRGETFEVIAHAVEPRSLINRLVVYVSPAGFDLIEPAGTFYGVLARGDLRDVRSVLERGSFDNAEALSTKQVREANEDFWAGNGTPLLLLLIGMISVFAAVATYLGQRAEQEQNRLVLGTLWAIGLTRWQMVEVQLLRSLLAIGMAIPIGWLAANVLLGISNRSIIGFSADAQIGHLVASTALLCVGALVAAVSLQRRNRDATPYSS